MSFRAERANWLSVLLLQEAKADADQIVYQQFLHAKALTPKTEELSVGFLWYNPNWNGDSFAVCGRSSKGNFGNLALLYMHLGIGLYPVEFVGTGKRVGSKDGQ